MRLTRSPLARTPRPKKCAAPGCPVKFVPRAAFQKACSPDCALALVDRAKAQAAKVEAKRQREAAKAERAALKQRKEAIKTRKEWLAEAKYWLHRWIRLVRDADKPCICCGIPANSGEALTGGYWDASHYVSVGSNKGMELEPRNIHKGCKRCNRDLRGNYSAFKRGLVERYGQAEVDWLEGPHEAKHYSIDDFRRLRDYYKGLCKKAGKQ